MLDIYSGSVHAVDELAYAAIALVDAGHPRAEAADLLAKKYADPVSYTHLDVYKRQSIGREFILADVKIIECLPYIPPRYSPESNGRTMCAPTGEMHTK